MPTTKTRSHTYTLPNSLSPNSEDGDRIVSTQITSKNSATDEPLPRDSQHQPPSSPNQSEDDLQSPYNPPNDSPSSEDENENEIGIGVNRRVPQALLREEPSTNSTDTPPSNELVKATKEIEKQKKEITRLTSENMKMMKQIVKVQQSHHKAELRIADLQSEQTLKLARLNNDAQKDKQEHAEYMLSKKSKLANDEVQNKKSTITYSADAKIATNQAVINQKVSLQCKFVAVDLFDLDLMDLIDFV